MIEFLQIPCPLPPASSGNTLDAVKTVVSVLSIPVACLTFWLGHRQREKERTRGYYQKFVVDAVIDEMMKVFAEEITRTTVAGRLALEGSRSARKTVPRECTIALAEFSESIFTLKDKIIDRVVIFDERLSNEIHLGFEAVQDEVTAWFNDVGLHKRKDIEEIKRSIQTSQRELVRRLYRGDAKGNS